MNGQQQDDRVCPVCRMQDEHDWWCENNPHGPHYLPPRASKLECGNSGASQPSSTAP